MISAQSHRQRLSGNRLIIILLIGCFVQSCGIFSPTGKKSGKVDDQLPGTVDREVEKVDTIAWTKVPESEVMPILVRNVGPKTEFKSAYNIVLVAPFDSRQLQHDLDRVSSRMRMMMEFYVGLKYALEFLSPAVDINLSVVDTEHHRDFETKFTEIPAITEADIIIGPYFTHHVKAVAKYALEEEKIMISPWNTTDISAGNPFYVRLRPSLKIHAQVITAFARSKFDLEDIMLFTRNNTRDTAALAFFQNANTRLEGGGATTRIPELLIDSIADPDLLEHLTTLMTEDSLKSFILPVWYDEPYVIAALAKLNFAKADQELTVFGLPQWMDMERMDYDYFESLQVHLSSAKPVSFNSDNDLRLKSHYFNMYGDLPTSDIFYGKDVMIWLSTLLAEAGTLITDGFGKSLDFNTSHQFEMVSVYGDDEGINYYENQHIQVVKFQDYRFQPADKF